MKGVDMRKNEQKKIFDKVKFSTEIPKVFKMRLSHIKRIAGADFNIGDEVSKIIYPLILKMEKKYNIDKDDWKNKKYCPECDGLLVIRKSKDREFYGCTNYPKCKHTEKL